MLNRDVAKMIRSSSKPVYVTALVREDTRMVRAYKNDVLAILDEQPLTLMFEPSVDAAAIYLHNA